MLNNVMCLNRGLVQDPTVVVAVTVTMAILEIIVTVVQMVSLMLETQHVMVGLYFAYVHIFCLFRFI